MKIKRFFILPFLAIITVATMAQSPEAVLENLRKYPNLAFPEASSSGMASQNVPTKTSEKYLKVALSELEIYK